MKVYLNNKFIDEEKATINIKDRGLLLGDSIFDTLLYNNCLLYTSPSPRDNRVSRMPSSA